MTTIQFSLADYQKFLDQWDPTPDFAYDGWKVPPDQEQWIFDQMDEIGLY